MYYKEFIYQNFVNYSEIFSSFAIQQHLHATLARAVLKLLRPGSVCKRLSSASGGAARLETVAALSAGKRLATAAARLAATRFMRRRTRRTLRRL